MLFPEAVLKLYDSEIAEGFILRLSWSCMILKLLKVLFWGCPEAVWFSTLLKVLFCGSLEVVWFWSYWRFYSEAVLKFCDSKVAEGFILRLSWSCMIEVAEGFILTLSLGCMILKLLKVLYLKMSRSCMILKLLKGAQAWDIRSLGFSWFLHHKVSTCGRLRG